MKTDFIDEKVLGGLNHKKVQQFLKITDLLEIFFFSHTPNLAACIYFNNYNRPTTTLILY